MKSVKIPGITEQAISTYPEILAFTTLPYYQVTGILKSGEGAVSAGDFVAWETSSKKFIKFDMDEVAVVDEKQGPYGSDTFQINLTNDYLLKGTVANAEVRKESDGSLVEEIVEDDDFIVNYTQGSITFIGDKKIASGNYLHIDYYHAKNGGTEAAVAVGVARYDADSTSADVPIEVVVGGAVKSSVIRAGTNISDNPDIVLPLVLVELRGRESEAAGAILF